MTDATKLTPIVCKADVFDEGVGCVLGVIENHSVRPLTRDELEQLIARLGEAEKQIADDWPEDDDERYDRDWCDRCGGEGHIEYAEAGPSVWGEDCPSEVNHLVECPDCGGHGFFAPPERSKP